ncbi:MAG: acetate kinase [Acidobacteriota bacterium]|nr:acetate kinase [Acidobacteriota bacterium]
MKILVLNAGSSSLKFEIWEMQPEKLILQDTVERTSSMTDALRSVFEKAAGIEVDAAGHRIVHGGDRFRESVVIDADVEKQIEELSALAPLHNPHNLEAYRAARQHLPNVKHVAVFDTAFHQTLPAHAYAYALPWEFLTQKKIRRYGFHGISHRYVSGRFAELHDGAPAHFRMITCHLGNGCSVCAINGGESIDTSMGFTPLEGLVMGSRSGDIDAGAVLYLITHEGLAPDEVSRVLNNESGLKGLSGVSNDMRDILKAADGGDERANLAVDAFCYRVRKYIGSYLAAMNGADVLIFTGGIGENSAAIRTRICAGLDSLGIALDSGANEALSQADRQIGNSAIPVWVIPTKEELLIARDTLKCL